VSKGAVVVNQMGDPGSQAIAAARTTFVNASLRRRARSALDEFVRVTRSQSACRQIPTCVAW
jgi:hypothetical protein